MESLDPRPIGRPPVMAACHSERERFDGQFCLECYLAAGGAPLKMATCRHHRRRAFAGHGLCKPCYMAKWSREHPDANSGAGWRRRNPDRARQQVRRQHLKQQFGLTIEQYETMWRAQGGRCANPNCDATAAIDAADRKMLQVDHCHRTGKIRGLLCQNCNTALGHVDDDPRALLGLIEYLRGGSDRDA